MAARANCSCRGTGRMVYASLIIVHLLLSICALGVALGFDWTRVDLFQSNGCPCNCTHAPCTQNCCVSKGSVHLSLFDLRMEMLAANVTGSPPVAQDGIYQTIGLHSSTINIKTIPVVLAGSLASAVLSFVCLFFAGASLCCIGTNSHLYRPIATVIYLLCLFSSIFAVTALAAFLDFYVWELRDGFRLLLITSFHVNSASYIPLTRLDWSFYVHAGGVCCSVIAFALACGIASLILTSSPAAAPPLPKADPPPYSAIVTVLAYDKDQGKWIVREKPKESEKQLAIEAYNESKDSINTEETVATATL